MNSDNKLNQVLHWKIYTAVLLFLSTFLLYYWWLITGKEVYYSTFKALQAIPVILNVGAWLWWFIKQYFSLISIRYSDSHDDLSNEDSIFHRHNILYREIRLSIIISVMVGLQVIFMGVVSLFLNFARFL